MSRRKQAKPQQLRAEEEEQEAARRSCRADAEGSEAGEESHTCDRCCAQFFTWNQLSEHQRACAEDPMKDSPTEASPAECSPVPSVESSDSSAAESTDGGSDLVADRYGVDNPEDRRDWDEAVELQLSPQEKSTSCPQTVSGSCSVPSTNVTLEILHSTRVAVAQFSQGLNGVGGRIASAALPVILEHLLALQQQQVHQLQLIEQICSQVAVMNKQPTQAALNLATRSVPLPAAGIIPPPAPSLSGTTPSPVHVSAAVTLSSVTETSQSPPSQTFCGQSTFALSENSSLCSGSVPALPFTGTRSHTLSPSGAPTLPQPGLSSSSGLPFLPHSSPSSVIFPNPLVSIAATANALDPLAALMKQRKGKLPSMFETKPSPDEPFFKHKCRFCAKVFGSDSALQIHLRSHTGERPFKCNICGNRFSTKGNLKVHFQRHKDKYPYVQMNPFPVPEYLDSVPTSSGIPYGMSVLPEKQVSSWLDSKPVAATLPARDTLPLCNSAASQGGSDDPVGVAACVKSPYRAAAGECLSASPNQGGSSFSPFLESNYETEASKALNRDGVALPQSCPPTPSPEVSSRAATPKPYTCASPNSLSFQHQTDLDDPMQASETSKLQQLVENIDKKMTEPNQCVLCQRVLSCQSALKMHYRVHTGERPFKCKVCGRAFTTKGNLKTHVGVHREDPPVHLQHSCPICQKKFTSAVVLQQHIRMHMVGPLSDSVDGPPEMDSESNFDSLSCNGNELTDDISMEEEDEEEAEEASEDTSKTYNCFISHCTSPKNFTSSVVALESPKRMTDCGFILKDYFPLKPLTNGLRDSQIASECFSSEKTLGNSPCVSESSSSPTSLASLFQPVKPLSVNRPETQELPPVCMKQEQTESPSSSSADAEGGDQPSKVCMKEETPYSVSFQLSRDKAADQMIYSPVPSSGAIKVEVSGHIQPNGATEAQLATFGVSGSYSSAGSPGATSLLGPTRRAPKQHNCNACGKNFSSASALQIHERTHTGEKPFVCSVCGRAFTTKGNLKVHMGTHMWNNAPARRGRRLSVENPIALLGGDALKFGEVFQKDLAARAMNVDPGFWNRYATAITNSLALKNNEISVIQNRGIAQLHPLSTTIRPMSGLNKATMDLGGNRHFSMLIDEGKEIGIN